MNAPRFLVRACGALLLIATGGCAARAQTPAGTDRPAPRPEGIKPYAQVIPTSAAADSGMFIVHHSGDKVFFEIPDSLLGREMLMISRWASVPANFGGFNPAGFSAQEQVMTWERHGERILLRKHSYDQVAADSAPIALSVAANNLAPIVGSFAIEAFNPDSSAVVIDVTEFYEGDTPAIGALSPARRREYGVRRWIRTAVSSRRREPIR